MNKWLSFILLTSLCLPAYPQTMTNDPIVIVINAQNPIDKMTRSEVIDIFMGKYVAFANGDKAIAFDLNSEQDIKKRFYQALVGRSLASINAYWSRIRFSGRMRVSQQFSSSQEVANEIEGTKLAIGYIPKSLLTNKLKVVYELNE